jgi:sulfur transfer complex TusBCD TusB component (DsrH family)
MKSRTISILFLSAVFLCLEMNGHAQIVTANPLEWMALAEGNELVNKQMESQIKGQTQTAALQNAIAAEFNRIHGWQEKYNSYLKTASGYASSLKACTHLYNDGVRIFITLGKLWKAAGDNPQGIAATLSMNNLYMETATELVSVFTLLEDAVAKGGPENMLTGAERSKTLWALNDKLSAFSKKLSLLHLSIRYYTLADVWNNITAGMLDRSYGEVASMALDRWKRAAGSASR